MPSFRSGNAPPLTTPDGRYIVVRGRLWRRADPNLPEMERARWVKELMAARRAVAVARQGGLDEAEAHRRVDAAKVALGERGPVWWHDDAPDLNRHMARTTPYAAWFAAQGPASYTAHLPQLWSPPGVHAQLPSMPGFAFPSPDSFATQPLPPAMNAYFGQPTPQPYSMG